MSIRMSSGRCARFMVRIRWMCSRRRRRFRWKAWGSGRQEPGVRSQGPMGREVRMNHKHRLGIATLALALGLAGTRSAPGDVVFYRLPVTSGAVVMLEGTAVVNPGGTVTFNHPKFGKIHFDLESTEIKKAPSLISQFNRVLG